MRHRRRAGYLGHVRASTKHQLSADVASCRQQADASRQQQTMQQLINYFMATVQENAGQAPFSGKFLAASQ